jgi:hypothetical protein
MDLKNGNISAFPVRYEEQHAHSPITREQCNGITKREYFSAMALQAAMARTEASLDEDLEPKPDYDMIATICVKMADALLKKLEEC